ncbi:MAG: 4-(cytidine 5'-diphospho)-2-C-methyl-D-erythritol kinase [Bacteroidetes bacterium SW_11_45_7]|nr:MAG: 4-(cytidine 5'-diphospho)-2-C-methyl-D-erythritol kinase [Bacteroidetes bacterium SW_11_45_7]
MVVFPHAKINLGLRITNQRPNGFHDIETVFYPLPWRDALEAVPAKEHRFDQYGLDLACQPSDNLCEQAIQLLAADFDLSPHAYCLYKAIPACAGLGGGSSNAAFTLKLINQLHNLKLTTHQLEAYAAQLGSDCPFFIQGRPVLGTGRGEVMQPIHLDLSGFTISVVFPGIEIDTGWAYSQIIPEERQTSLAEVVKQPVAKWQETVANDFEQPIMEAHPAIQSIQDKLLAKGAILAMMSGSGSAVFGLFDDDAPKCQNLAREIGIDEKFVWVGKL